MIHQKDLIFLVEIIFLFSFYLVGLMVVYFIRYNKKKKSHDKIKLELQKENSEKQKLLSQQKDAINKLKNAEVQINKFREDIKQKRELISELKKGQSNEQSTFVEELEKTIILTKDDWRKFKVNFQSRYPNYVDRILKQYPNITKAEIRLLVLAKLDLSYSEMAQLQGVSSHAVRVTWYRLRDKINKKNMSLKEFIKNIPC